MGNDDPALPPCPRDESNDAAAGRWPRPQFSLKTLLLAVTLAAGLCGLIVSASPLWAVMIAWFFVLVAGHVLGNWWGTRIGRKRRDRPLDVQPATGPVRYAPATRLRHHVVLGRAMFISTVVSAIGGCALGLIYLTQQPKQVTTSGLVVGAISAAVIGGVFGFLTSAFFTVTTCALHEACIGRRVPRADEPDRHCPQHNAPTEEDP